MKPNSAQLASYQQALRQRDLLAARLRQDALIRDWNRQRDIVKVLRRYWTVSMYLFATLAFFSALSIVLRVL